MVSPSRSPTRALTPNVRILPTPPPHISLHTDLVTAIILKIRQLAN